MLITAILNINLLLLFMIDQLPGDPFICGMIFGLLDTIALPLSSMTLRYFEEVLITTFCLKAGALTVSMVAFLGETGEWVTLMFFYMSVFFCAAALNMYFMVVEVRVVPNVFGSIIELTLCCAYLIFGFAVMTTLISSPW